MKRNKTCPLCFIRRLFRSNPPTSERPNLADYENGAPKTPPMGWSTWNTFRNRIDENMILETARAMRDSGLIEAGYNRLNLDDNWQSSMRDENGDLQGDLQTFPHGIKWLADELNSMGLKLGAYTSNGTLTCEDLPASLGREKADAYTLAKWGVEYFKYDFCHNEQISRYAPLVYSISISKDGETTEYSVHNAVVGGLARFMTDKSLPTGGYVSGLDKNYGDITYNNIEVEREGDYALSINVKKFGRYEKYLVAKINDGKEYEIDFPAQKKHNVTGRFQTVVHLNAGKNKIKLYNPVTSKSDSEMYQYRRMGLALKEATARVALERGAEEKPITFSICEWGWGKPQYWGAKAGNLWRTTPDIRPWWFWIKMIYNHTVKLYEYSSAGHFNDPDMLEVGNGKLSYNQNVSHFSLWCMMNAPLILGNDLRKMPDNVKAIVTNKNMIAINQDPLCKQAKRVKRGTVDVLAKPLANGSTAICFFNKSAHSASIKYNLNKLCDDKYVSMKKANSYALAEQWSGEEISTADKVRVKLKKHESKVFIINAN
ncbi:MAG: alpha-galactosidase [Bacteroides sp.]|nr:alpha-galactosidase [Bacillota bacterium]MCM1393470.1 alpha-galactosidase [[Eubacterium] siraeum]MCM1455296.1 alpha-galactosidase [Bacteroides sp.]